MRQTGDTGKVVTFTTSNINVRGIRLPTVTPDEPDDIDLTDQRGEGVIIPGVVTGEILLATVVKYSSIQSILSEDELKNSVDNTIGSTDSLTIRSTIVSFTTEPQLNKSLPEPFMIVVQNNQV